ncbi:MFS transporter [Azospirillum sp. TSH100]|uniref:MFS transporter n=2 Tax=Azospirillum sp. TSH100 TaxID=652764 RepID=UPI00145BBD0A|nr:MFS transporter [Azospirillum sp. TSH100]
MSDAVVRVVPSRAATAQSVSLILPVILPVMAAVLVAPVIPDISRAFAAVPNAGLLVPVAITIPALMLALFSPLAGWLADRFGRKRLLVAALLAYAVCGVAPIWLDHLPAIILSRALLGICEAAVMTCSTALICDHNQGRERAHWLAMQSMMASLSSIPLIVIGGLLGEQNWRTPFAIYGLAALIVPAILLLVEEAPREAGNPAGSIAVFPRRRFAIIGLLALAASLLFYIMPIQIGFLLAMQGITSPQKIGLATATGSLAILAGSMIFRRLPRKGTMPAAATFACMGAGLLTMVLARDFAGVVAGAVLHGFGWGIALPLLLTMAMAGLPFDLRGRGTGVFMGAVFIGQFLSPLGVAAIDGVLGGLVPAIKVFAILSLLLAVAAAVSLRETQTDD